MGLPDLLSRVTALPYYREIACSPATTDSRYPIEYLAMYAPAGRALVQC